MAKTTAGTQRFMAPELFLKEDSYSLKADVWSLGLTFYEMMMLRMDMLAPYLEVFRNRKFHQDVEQKLLALKYSRRLVQLILQCLEVADDARIGIEDILEQLEALANAKRYNLIEQVDIKRQPLIFKSEAARDAIGRVWLDAASVGNTIYMFGGQECQKRTFLHNLRQIQLTADNQIEVSEVEGEKNTEILKILAGHKMVSIGHKLYVFGGVEAHSQGYSNSLFIFDTITKEWSEAALTGEVPAGVEGHTLVPIQHEDQSLIYVIGGYSNVSGYLGMYTINTTTFECHQVQESPDDNPEDIRVKGYYHISVGYNDKIYTIGGYFQGGKRTGHPYIWVYCTRSKRWLRRIELPSNIYPYGVSEHYATVVGDNMLIYGGRQTSDPSTLDTITVFNFSSQQWNVPGIPPQPGSLELYRGGHAILPVPNTKNQLLLIGGFSKLTEQNDFNIIEYCTTE
jgi:hypothetical protein